MVSKEMSSASETITTKGDRIEAARPTSSNADAQSRMMENRSTTELRCMIAAFSKENAVADAWLLLLQVVGGEDVDSLAVGGRINGKDVRIVEDTFEPIFDFDVVDSEKALVVVVRFSMITFLPGNIRFVRLLVVKSASRSRIL